MTHDAFSPQQQTAVQKLLSNYSFIHWQLLESPMQSGKTETFLLTAFEMLRQGTVEHVVIMSGSADLKLKDQTIFNYTAHRSSFIRKYYNYLLKNLTYSLDEVHSLVNASIQAVSIAWGNCDIKSHVPKDGTTLVIWDESHYAQSIGQAPDKFWRKYHVCADGSSMPDNVYVLAVSATPISELSNLYTYDQPKIHVKMEVGDNYNSIQKMVDTGRLHYFDDWETQLRSCAGGSAAPAQYCIVRATPKNYRAIETIMSEFGWKVFYFDSHSPKSSEQEWDEMSQGKAPVQNTCFILKHKCRMGQNIYKKHICFVFETCIHSKTDTLLQSLAGRACGYGPGADTIHVYIHHSYRAQIDTYIRGDYNLWAMNTLVSKTGATRVLKAGLPMAPVRVYVAPYSLEKYTRQTLLDYLCAHLYRIHCLVTRRVFEQCYDEEPRRQIKIVSAKQTHKTASLLAELNEAVDSQRPCYSFGTGAGFAEQETHCRIYIVSNEMCILHCRDFNTVADPFKLSLPRTTKREITASQPTKKSAVAVCPVN
jgi:hypothetical protein